VDIKRAPGLFVALVLVIVLAMAAGCGDDDDDEEPTATTAPAATATAPAGETPTEGGGDGDGDAEAGRQLAGAQCAACHTTDGSTGVGPSWQGLFGSEITLESGETITADEAYIRESILDPNAKVHEGFPASVMPSFDGVLTDAQIDQLIAYIRTL
jgi:mono/diheme cytochrome c family protein